MNLREDLRLAFENLRSNMMRTFLTMLGIIIGISAVITITTLGSSLQKTLEATFKQMGGVNQISAFVNEAEPVSEEGEEKPAEDYPAESTGPTEEQKLTYSDILKYQEAFKDRVNGVVIQSYVGGGQASGTGDALPVNMSGITKGYLESQKLKIVKGRDISEKDNLEARPVALVSDLFVKNTFKGESPIGKPLDVSVDGGQIIRLYVVGVYHYDRARITSLGLADDSGSGRVSKKTQTPLFIPYEYAQALTYANGGESSGITYFTIGANSDTDPTSLAEDSKAWFAENKWPDGSYSLDIYNDMDQMAQIQKILTIVTIVIAVIAAISLIVGGVGVMNIMLVSVVERTREIGIRKALGARNRSIEMQFLSETIVICLIGGLIGVMFGLLNGVILAKVGGALVMQKASSMAPFMTLSVQPSIPAIVISVAFSILTGLIFGIYPAHRAARMSPIDALRYE